MQAKNMEGGMDGAGVVYHAVKTPVDGERPAAWTNGKKIEIKESPQERLSLPPKNAARFLERMMRAARIDLGPDFKEKQPVILDDLVDNEGKFTDAGAEFAKAFYAGINFGGFFDVQQRIRQLRERADEVKAGIDYVTMDLPARAKLEEWKEELEYMALPHRHTKTDSESTQKERMVRFMRKMASSLEMQLRNETAAGMRQEELAETGPESWKGVFESAGKKGIDNAAMMRLMSLRNQLIGDIYLEKLQFKSTGVYGATLDEQMNLLRVWEKRMIGAARESGIFGLADGEKAPSGVDMVDTVYQVDADGNLDLKAIEAQLSQLKEELEKVAELPEVKVVEVLNGDKQDAPVVSEVEFKVIPKEVELADVLEHVKSLEMTYNPITDMTPEEQDEFFAQAKENLGGTGNAQDLQLEMIRIWRKARRGDGWDGGDLRQTAATTLGPTEDLSPAARKKEKPRKLTVMARLATTVGTFASAFVGLFGAWGSQPAPTEADIQAEMSRRRQLNTVDVGENWVNTPDVLLADLGLEINTINPETKMAPFDQQAMDHCLTPVKMKDGTVFWGYSKNSGDETCKKYFPAGAVLAGGEEYKAAFPEKLVVPKNLQEYILVKHFVRYTEQGSTCSLTSIASIISTILNEQGLAGYHPSVFSDLARGVDNDGNLLPKVVTEYTSLNKFYFDVVGMEKFGISIVVTNIHDKGSDNMFQNIAEDMKAIMAGETVKNVASPEQYKEAAKIYYESVMDQLKKGMIPTVASYVSKDFGHVVTAVGGYIDEKTGEYVLLVNEPNGGYTGWEFTKGNWESVEGGNGLVKIPLTATNMRLIAPYAGYQVTFTKFDQSLMPLPTKEIKLTFAIPDKPFRPDAQDRFKNTTVGYSGTLTNGTGTLAMNGMSVLGFDPAAMLSDAEAFMVHGEKVIHRDGTVTSTNIGGGHTMPTMMKPNGGGNGGMKSSQVNRQRLQQNAEMRTARRGV